VAIQQYNITEDFQYDLSLTNEENDFKLTDISYDFAVNNIPFIISASRDNPYIRETAQYRRDQVDNSPEPGEQSLVGWWLRSQTSWHNGAGITYYDPGTDFERVSHRFYDSRGIDVWTIGEAKLLKDTAEIYTSAYTVNASPANDGTNSCLVLGNSNGQLLKAIPSGDSVITPTNIYGSLKALHTSANPFLSVTNDGKKYYAICNRSIHVGNIDGTGADITPLTSATSITSATIKYGGGFVYLGVGSSIYVLTAANLTTDVSHDAGTLISTITNTRAHFDTNWKWTSFTVGNLAVYASGFSNDVSEIWAIPFDTGTLTPNAAKAYVVAQMPRGERINKIEYYLGYLGIGTTKGMRVAEVNPNDGSVTYGSLLWDGGYAVNWFAVKDNYMYAATSINSTYTNGPTYNAVLKRVDLGTPLGNGEFPYANDMEYQSTYNSIATEVYNIGDRMVIINSGNSTYELQIQSDTNYRTSGWIQTGRIRYGTSEPKFFKYLDARGRVTDNDTILVSTVDSDNNQYDITSLDTVTLNTSFALQYPQASQEYLSIKFTFNNSAPTNAIPVLESYQLKSIPASRRQRIFEYPLSCFDNESDKNNIVFGYPGRAYASLTALEELEENGDFVTIQDFRLSEKYLGIIEKVSFTNVVSPDNGSSNFGGKLAITVRKV
jgi:hypothetical protein